MSLLVRDLPTADTAAPDELARSIVVRVNLLPPEILESARLRRVRAGLAAGLVGVVGAVAVLYAGAAGSVADAGQTLEAATARQAQLRSETTRYADVDGVYARTAAAREMLAQAMGQEVRYSELLDDLSLTVPDRVWLTSIEVTQAPAASGGLGTVTFTGSGTSHDDVAAWLESLSEHEALADAAFSSSTATTVGSRRTVAFTSTATLTSAALSKRHTVEAG
jgi:Tfp pilus assembly protein PilN